MKIGDTIKDKAVTVAIIGGVIYFGYQYLKKYSGLSDLLQGEYGDKAGSWFWNTGPGKALSNLIWNPTGLNTTTTDTALAKKGLTTAMVQTIIASYGNATAVSISNKLQKILDGTGTYNDLTTTELSALYSAGWSGL